MNKMEAIPADDNDRPERDIRIKEVSVFVDPFEVYQTRLKRKLAHEANADEEEAERRRKREKEDSMGWFGLNTGRTKKGVPSTKPKAVGGGVGKYLQGETSGSITDDIPDEVPKKAKKPVSGGYGNFDNF